jgi:hypothetical protein
MTALEAGKQMILINKVLAINKGTVTYAVLKKGL